MATPTEILLQHYTDLVKQTEDAAGDCRARIDMSLKEVNELLQELKKCCEAGEEPCLPTAKELEACKSQGGLWDYTACECILPISKPSAQELKDCIGNGGTWNYTLGVCVLPLNPKLKSAPTSLVSVAVPSVAATAEECCDIKITKFIEFENPIINSKGQAVSKVAIRNAFLIERIDQTVQYQAELDRYYQKLCSCGGSNDTADCCSENLKVLETMFKLIQYVWDCVRECCNLMDQRSSTLYDIIVLMNARDDSMQQEISELSERVNDLENP